MRGSSLVKQSFLQLDQLCLPQSLHEQGCECDFDRVERQERDDALCEADGEGDVHQVYVPKCTEGVAGKNAQNHGTDQRPEGLGAGGDEADDACAEDVADDVAAGRTGDDVQAAVKPREYRKTDTAEQDIDELRQGAVFEAQTACGQQDAEYGEIDRHAGRQRNRNPGADCHNGGENAADNKRISGCCFSFCVCVHFLVSLSGYMGCCGTELCAKVPQNHIDFTVYGLCSLVVYLADGDLSGRQGLHLARFGSFQILDDQSAVFIDIDGTRANALRKAVIGSADGARDGRIEDQNLLSEDERTRAVVADDLRAVKMREHIKKFVGDRGNQRVTVKAFLRFVEKGRDLPDFRRHRRVLEAVDANADDDLLNLSRLKICLCFCQNTAELFFVEVNIVNPLDLWTQSRQGFQGAADCDRGHRGDEHRLAQFELRTESEAHVDALACRGVEAAPQSAASGSLFLRNDKLRQGKIRESLGIIIRGIHLVEKVELERNVQGLADRVPRQNIRFLPQPIAGARQTFDCVALLLQRFDRFPDRVSGHAEGVCKLLPGGIAPFLLCKQGE